MSIVSKNPATGEELVRYDALSGQAVTQKVQRAEEAFRLWHRTSFQERADILRRIADILESEKQRWGELMSREMGKPIQQAVAEAEKSAWGCRYYADHAQEYLRDEVVQTDARRSFISYQPLGAILAVMPWNFPFWQVFRFSAPGLMAGNVVLLKHASNVPQCALAIEEIVRRAGAPEGVFQTLLIGSDRVPELIAQPVVRAVTLTGSVPAGIAMAQAAGAQVKKTVLELGGSDAFIVLPSADLDVTAEVAVQARLVNNGQSCIAGKRFIVHEQVADAFQQRFVDRMASVRVGDPLDPATELGPLATPDLVDILERQVRESLSAGARALVGGARLDRPGNYYAATVLTDIPPQSPAYREELFGPVAALFRVPDLDAAIRLANDSDFGLGCSAWTNDEGEWERLVRDIDSGMVFINELVKSDLRVPFGGVKHSGYGRELHRHGIQEFVNVKTIWINNAPPASALPTRGPHTE